MGIKRWLSDLVGGSNFGGDGSASKPRPRAVMMGLEAHALEPRLLYDAALPVVVAEAVQAATDHHDASADQHQDTCADQDQGAACADQGGADSADHGQDQGAEQTEPTVVAASDGGNRQDEASASGDGQDTPDTTAHATDDAAGADTSKATASADSDTGDTTETTPEAAAAPPDSTHSTDQGATNTDADTSSDHGGTTDTTDADHAVLDAAATDATADDGQVTSLVVIDGRVEGAQDLADAVRPGTEVIILDADQDGLDQISQALADHEDIQAIHVISHGEEGSVQLGSTTLDQEEIQSRSAQLEAWSTHLTDDADILLYGCSTGDDQAGLDLLAALRRVTGADVAASDDPTGGDAAGGDWDLEVSLGHIEAHLPIDQDVLHAYAGTLAGEAPQVTLDGTWTVNEDTQLVFDGNGLNGHPRVTVSDVDGEALTITLVVDHGSLTLGTTAGLSNLTGDGTTTLSFQADQATANTALASLIYQGAQDNNDDPTLSVTVSDGDFSDTDTQLITINAVDDQPQIDGPSATLYVDEDGSLAMSGLNLIQIVQPADEDGQTLTITLEAQHGTLDLADASGLDSHGGEGTGTLTLVGDRDSINTALGGLSYHPEADYNGDDTLDITANDGSTGDVSSSVALVVNAMPDAQITATATATVDEDTALTFDGQNGHPGITIYNPDGDLVTVDLGVGHGTLTLGDTTGLTQSSGTGTASVSIQGTAAAVNNALAHLSYQGEADYNGNDSLSISTQDAGGNTDSATMALTVDAVDDAVDITCPATFNANEDGTLVLAGISVDDPDDSVLTVTLSAAHGQLSFDATGLQSSSGSAGALSVQMQGTAAAINTALATLNYRPPADYNSTIDGNDSLSISVADGGSGGPYTASAAIVVAAQPDCVITADAAATGQEDTWLAFDGQAGNPSITVADPDGDQLTITLSVSHGELAFSADPGAVNIITQGGDTLSFSGSVAQVNLALAVLQYRGATNYNSDAGTDTLVITLADDNAANTSTQNMTITLTPVEDTPVLQNSAMTADEGASAVNPSETVITEDMLLVTDAESSGAGLVYTLNSLPASGQIWFNGEILEQGDTFTQADVAAGRVSYANLGSEAETDSFSFTCRDQAGNGVDGSLAITINPYNDPLTLTMGSYAVAEGGTQAITAAALLAQDQDPDSGAADMVYTITAVEVSEGSLTLDGQVIGVGATFTQADIDAGLLVYSHGGGEPTVDQTITFTVSDGQNELVGQVLNLRITPVNDAPTVDPNPSVTLAEGATYTLLATDLDIADPDNLPAQVTFKVTQVPTQGSFTVNGSQVGVGTIFSWADISAGKVKYTHNGSENFSDSLLFTVNDGAGGTVGVTTLGFVITPVNDQVQVSQNASVWEGLATGQNGRGLNLAISDPDDNAANITVRIDSLPTNGTLSFNGSAVNIGQTFTADQLALLSYQHDGNDQNFGHPPDETFQITVTDAGGGQGEAFKSSVTTTVTIAVAAVNDDPVVATLDTLVVADAGGETVLGNTVLLVTDVDSAVANLTYQVESLPTVGNLQVFTGGQWVSCMAGSTFTQADINAGLVKYVHTGVTTGYDSIDLTVRDGSYNAVTGLAGAVRDGDGAIETLTLNIQIGGGAPPVLVNNYSQILAELGSVTVDYIDATDADSANGALIYTITQDAAHGQLVLNTGGGDVALNQGDTFTQADLNAGYVIYRHTEADNYTDTFKFTLADSTGLAAVTSTGALVGERTHYFYMRVADTLPDFGGGSGGDGRPTLEVSLGAAPAVNEDGYVVIDDSNIIVTDTTPGDNTDDWAASSVYITFDALTNHYGEFQVLRGGSWYYASDQTIITLADLQAGGLRYYASYDSYNTDDPVFHDTLTFTVLDGAGREATAGSPNTLSVDITGTDDNPILREQSNLELDEGDTGTITTSMLRSTDVDNTAAEILYVVQTGPAHGQLLLNGALLGVGDTFSQADITGGLVTYTHDGGETTADTFVYTLSDFNAVNGVNMAADDDTGVNEAGQALGETTFYISIRNTNDPPVMATNEIIQPVDEGASVIVTSAMLQATDPDNSADELVYTVIDAPADGYLSKNLGTAEVPNWVSIPAYGSFTQADIDAGLIRYTHDNVEEFVDTFTFKVSDGSSLTIDGTATVHITPVNDAPTATTGTLECREGETAVLDADALTVGDPDNPHDNQTGSTNPDTVTFTLTALPTHGELQYDQDHDGTFEVTIDAGNMAGFTFTQADIVAGYLRYAHDSSENFSDSFGVLVDDNTSEANATTAGTVAIDISPLNDTPTMTPGAPGVAVNTGASVYEGQEVTITEAELLAWDPDSTDQQVQYRLTTGVTTGSLVLKLAGGGERVLSVGSVFTSDDLKNDRLVYRHNGEAVYADSFQFQVDDGGNDPADVPGLPKTTFNLTIDPVNDPPVIAAPTTLNGQEDKSLVITDISVSDPDLAETLGAEMTVILSVDSGTLSLASGHSIVDFSQGDGVGDSTMTFRGTLAAINAALYGMTYTPASNVTGAAHLSVTVRDEGNTGTDPSQTGIADLIAQDTGGDTYEEATAAVTINLAAVNDGPSLTPESVNQIVNEDTDLVFQAANNNRIVLGDVDAAGADVRVTLSVEHGTLNLATTLGLTSVSGNSTGSVTLQGSLAEVQAAIDGLRYRGSQDYNGADSLTIGINDLANTGVGGAKTASTSVDITVLAVNDPISFAATAPDTPGADQYVEVYEDVPIIFSAANGNAIQVADVDANEGLPADGLIRVTVALGADDVGILTLSGTTGLDTVNGNGTHSIELIGTLATVNAALEGMRYTPPAGDSGFTTTVTLYASDRGNTGSGGASEANHTFDLRVLAVNDAPSLTNPSSAPGQVTEDVVGGTNLGGIVFSDPDTPGDHTMLVTLNSNHGAVTLNGDPVAAGLTVVAVGQGLQVTGSLDDLNTFFAAADAIHYEVTEANYNGSDRVRVTINDQDGGLSGVDPSAVVYLPEGPHLSTSGGADNEEAYVDINITVLAVNDAPTVNGAGGTVSCDEDARVAITGLSVADIDSTVGAAKSQFSNKEMELTLSVGEGVLDLETLTGLTFVSGSANGQSTLVVRGLLSRINTALATLHYTGDANYNGADQLTVTINDLDLADEGAPVPADGLTATGTVNITVNPVNDTPTITAPADQDIFDGGDSFTFSGANAITIGDVDSDPGDVTLTLAVTDAGARIHLGDAAAATISAGADDSTTVTLTGTLAEINQALDGMVVQVPGLAASAEFDLNLTLNDNGNTGSDPGLTGDNNDERATDSVHLRFSGSNNAPEITAPTTQQVNEDASLTFNAAGGNRISVADSDAFDGQVEVTVSLAGGSHATFSLGNSGAVTITGGGDGTNDTTVTFRGTLSQVNQALDGLVYTPSANWHTMTGSGDDPDTLTITVNDLGHTGGGGALTDTQAISITVNPVADAPTANAYSTTTTEDTPVTVSLSGQDNIDTGFGAADSNSLGYRVDTLPAAAKGVLYLSDGSTEVTAGMVLTGAQAGSLVFKPTTNYVGTVTFNYVAVDGDGQEGANTVQVVVTPIDDAPTITVPGAQTVAEEGNITFDGRILQVADVDAASGEMKVTVQVSHGTLDEASGSGCIVVSAAGGSKLTLTGTLTQVNNALNGLVYTGDTNYVGADQLQITVNDQGNTGAGGPLSANDTVDITVTPVNDAPVNTLPVAQSVLEETDLVFSAANGNALSIGDVDAAAGDLTTTVSVTHGTLTVTAAGTAEVSGSGGTTVTITGTLAEINAALEGLTYRGDTNFVGNDTLSLVTNDQGHTGTDPGLTGGDNDEQDSDSVTITVNPVNDAPTITVPGAQTVAEEGNITFGSRVLQVADVDAASGWVNVTVEVSHGTLTEASGSGCMISTFAGGSRLIITGTLTGVNNALNGLVYTADTNYVGSDQLQITVDDLGNTGVGGPLSASDTVDITLPPVNDPPVNSLPGSQNVLEETDLVFSTANGNALSVSDVDADLGELVTTVSVQHGTLTVTAAGTAEVNGSGGTSVSITGTLAEINAALQGLTYRGDTNFVGDDTLSVVTNDQGNTGTDPGLTGGDHDEQDSDSLTITVNPVDDAPTITVPGAQTVAEESQLTFGSRVLQVADVDAGSGWVDVTVEVSHGTLAAASGSGCMISTFAGGGKLTLTGTLTQVNNALNGLVYTGDTNYVGSDQLQITVDDRGNTGVGGPLSASDTVDITVQPVNDPPVNGLPVAQSVLEETDLVFQSGDGNAITITDVDAGAGELTATLTVQHGTLTVTAPGTAQVTGSGGATVSITGTLAEINAALEGLTYRGDTDFVGDDTLRVVTNDQGHTGSDPGTTGGPNDEEDGDDLTITVNPVDDAPVVHGPASDIGCLNGQGVIGGLTGIWITDPDVDNGQMRVTLNLDNGTMTMVSGSGCTVTGDGTDQVILEGTRAQINAALDGMGVNFAGLGVVEAQLDIDANDLGNTGVGGPLNHATSFRLYMTYPVVPESDPTPDPTPDPDTGGPSPTPTGTEPTPPTPGSPTPTGGPTAPPPVESPRPQVGGTTGPTPGTFTGSGGLGGFAALGAGGDGGGGGAGGLGGGFGGGGAGEGGGAPAGGLIGYGSGLGSSAPGGEDNFFILELEDQSLEVGRSFEYRIPESAVSHFDPNEDVTLSAKLPDGSPLPDWVKFNEDSQSFEITPPLNAPGKLVIVVEARDTDGNVALARFTLNINQEGDGTEGAPGGNDGPQPPATGAGAGAPAGGAGGGAATPLSHLAPPAHPGLDRMLSLAGPQGGKAEAHMWAGIMAGLDQSNLPGWWGG